MGSGSNSAWHPGCQVATWLLLWRVPRCDPGHVPTCKVPLQVRELLHRYPQGSWSLIFHMSASHSAGRVLFKQNRTAPFSFSKSHRVLVLKNKLLTWAACSTGSGSRFCPPGSTLQFSFLVSRHHHLKALAHSIPAFWEHFLLLSETILGIIILSHKSYTKCKVDFLVSDKHHNVSSVPLWLFSYWNPSHDEQRSGFLLAPSLLGTGPVA